MSKTNTPNSIEAISALEMLLTRRSVVAAKLGEPGPSSSELEQILQAGIRVPDHKVMTPWRFILFQGDARASFGEVLAECLAKTSDTLTDDKKKIEQGRFLRAPVVISVISRMQLGVVPEWEQTLSAGAVCQNILNAANALGFASQWITEWYAYDGCVSRALGLSGMERVAGFIYIGTPQYQPKDRRRTEVADVVTDWQPS